MAEANPLRLRAFLDNNVTVAVMDFLNGAASAVLGLCEAGQIEAMVNELVLTEVDRVVSAKLPRLASRLMAFLWGIKPTLVFDPSPSQLRAAAKLTHIKDAPILAAAKNSGAHYTVNFE